MKGDKPFRGSGKTHFNRIKQYGQSWIVLRDTAIKEGKWSLNTKHTQKENEDESIPEAGS